MFIRKIIKSHMGNKYTSYRLVTTYKDVAGKVHQSLLLNLGTSFNITEDKWKMLTSRIEDVLSDRQSQLFEIELPKNIEAMAQRIVKLLAKKQKRDVVATPQADAANSVNPDICDHQTVDINSAKDSDVRFIGGEYLGYHVASQLKLPQILKNSGFNNKQVDIALATIISRLVAPSSELKTHGYLTNNSALDEILDTDFTNLQLQQLYLASDRLLEHKEIIEQSLYKREQELFQLTEVITLFDLTNTYFEGHPKHDGANRGRSKEKRSDCDLISLGILLDGSGFPKKSKILPGNISEPSTLKDMLSDMSTQATVIMDAGIATKDNITYLKDNGYTYIVVRRDSNLTMPDNNTPVLVKDSLHNKVTVSLVKQTENEVNLFCHSTAKEEQNKEFTIKMMKRLEEKLTKLNLGLKICDLQMELSHVKVGTTAIILNNNEVYTNGVDPITMLISLNLENLDNANMVNFTQHEQLTTLLQNNEEVQTLLLKWTGQIKTKSKILNKLRSLFNGFVEETKRNTTREYAKVLEKVGRLKEHYKSVAYMYDIQVVADSNKINATIVKYTQNEDKLKNKQSGIYCLTSNRMDLSAASLWETYTMLTDIESAFKSLKSELGMRPVYHQLEHRIDGHLFINILGYHLLHTIRYQLKEKNIHYSWDNIRDIVSTQVRVTTTLNLKDGGIVKIRKTSKATPSQAEIYRALGISTNPLKLEKTYFRSELN